MINTTTIKPIGGKVFTIGPESAEERILIVGSCRSVPYINYFDRFIKMSGASIRVSFIDPNDGHWDEAGNLVDFDAVLQAQESNPSVLSAISEATVYLHEHYASYGMFNTSPESEKNIFQFGMNPRINVCIPNFHDHFILRNDFAAFGPVPDDWVELGNAAIEKFCATCRLSSFPEMAEHFHENWKTTRLFWTANHITKHFSLFIFRQMNERYLHLPLTDEFWRGAETEDLFSEPHTHLTAQDVEAYHMTWRD